MEASSAAISNESGDVVQNEDKTATFGLLWIIIGNVLLAGIGFFIGCFLGLVTALSTGLLKISVGC